MALKNYTSTVPANLSISLIEAKLAANGATKILKEYSEDGKVESIAFTKQINGLEIPFKLPARIEKCQTILKSFVKKPRADTLKRIEQQAQRTAWKIIYDWVDVQMSLIELAQAEFMQVFLPYVYDYSKEQTYFEKLKARGYQKLLQGAGEQHG